MKTVFSLGIFLFFGFIACAQPGYDRPEIAESDKKTEFSDSYFRVNYLTQNLLIQFLEQDNQQISFASESVKMRARDLYYAKSGEYSGEREIAYHIKEKYLTSESDKMKMIDSNENITEKLKSVIIENNLLDEIVSRIHFGFEIIIKENAIYALGPVPTGNSLRSIYTYTFNEDQKILSQNTGRITRFADTVFWISTNYEYKDQLLNKEVYKKCQDYKCAKGYDLEISNYEEGRKRKTLKQKYSRHNNDFIQEESLEFIYTKGVLDSVITNTYYVEELKRILIKVKIESYKKGKLMKVTEGFVKPQTFKDKRSVLENKYDKKGRLISLEYLGWDNNNDPSEIRREEFEYLEGKYIYRFIQSLKTERGKQKLPHQYELIYTFY